MNKDGFVYPKPAFSIFTKRTLLSTPQKPWFSKGLENLFWTMAWQGTGVLNIRDRNEEATYLF